MSDFASSSHMMAEQVEVLLGSKSSDAAMLSFSECDFTGYFGDSMKCCPSRQDSTVTDSGLSSMPSMSACSSSSSLVTFEAMPSSDPQQKPQPPIQDLPSHKPRRSPKSTKTPPVIELLAYLNWVIMGIFAFFRSMLLRLRLDTNNQAQELLKQQHFPPLYNHWDALFTQYIYRRMRDILNRPIAGRPGAICPLKDRVSYDKNWTYEYPGTTTDVINLGSYNYLGFSENKLCNEEAIKAVENYGIGLCGAFHECGSNQIHRQLETLMAEFLGVEDCFCTPMGFGTNTMNIPALVGKDALILSDELNHASLILGCRFSEAVTKVFRHNSARDCERVIIQSLRHGNPKTGKPYSKILIVVEGLYSMEGTIVHLKDFVELKKKYKAYLFMDEAHSIGAVGRTGRGVSEYWGVDPNDVDILMGTFTKSFSAAGGYIAGRKDTIDRIRMNSHAAYATTMSPPVSAQIIGAINVLMGRDGTDDGQRRLASLRVNTRHFRRRLRQAGFLVYGNADAPVVPTLAFFPSKVAELSRRLLEKRIGIVVVGFPATPIATERARFCLSAGHSIEQLDYIVDSLIEVSDTINIRYLKNRREYVHSSDSDVEDDEK